MKWAWASRNTTVCINNQHFRRIIIDVLMPTDKARKIFRMLKAKHQEKSLCIKFLESFIKIHFYIAFNVVFHKI